MIPAWRHCPSQWTLEYTGYLMTERSSHNKATHECVEKDAETVPGNQAIVNGGFSIMLKQIVMDYKKFLIKN